MKDMGIRIFFSSVNLTAAGSELGYVLAPSEPVISKYLVATWQVRGPALFFNVSLLCTISLRQ